MEGYGGPIKIENADTSHIDPTLDACCRREQEEQSKYNKTTAAIKRHDRISAAERRRRHVISNPVTHFEGCQCCYDVSVDGGGDYPALFDLRNEKRRQEEEEEYDGFFGGSGGGGGHNKDTMDNHVDSNDDDDSDSDSEFDYLLDEDLPTDTDNNNNNDNDMLSSTYNVISNFEQRRREELQTLALNAETLQHHGYGTHVHIHPTNLLRAADLVSSSSSSSKGKRRMLQDVVLPAPAIVVHLYKSTSRASASLDLFLLEGEEEKEYNKNGGGERQQSSSFCDQYRGTKFMYCDGRGFLQFLSNQQQYKETALPKKLSMQDLPALLLIKNGVVVSHVSKLQAFTCRGGGSGDDDNDDNDEEVDTRAVQSYLENAGMLLDIAPPVNQICGIIERPEEEALLDNMKMLALRGGGEGNTREEEEFYCCGVQGCQKTFYHEHVGIKTEENDGLVVKEGEVVG